MHENIKDCLLSIKKSENEKAIKLIIKNNLTGFDDELFEFLKKNIDKKTYWEINTKIIEFFGKNKYTKCSSLLEKICEKNIAHDMVTRYCATNLCRLKNIDKNGISQVMNFFSYGNFSLVNGALIFLGEDKITASKSQIEQIINFVNNLNTKQEKGYSDIRVGLALACAGREKNKNVIEFLNSCLESEYSPLVKIAKYSLKGKYSKI